MKGSPSRSRQSARGCRCLPLRAGTLARASAQVGAPIWLINCDDILSSVAMNTDAVVFASATHL